MVENNQTGASRRGATSNFRFCISRNPDLPQTIPAKVYPVEKRGQNLDLPQTIPAEAGTQTYLKPFLRKQESRGKGRGEKPLQSHGFRVKHGMVIRMTIRAEAGNQKRYE